MSNVKVVCFHTQLSVQRNETSEGQNPHYCFTIHLYRNKQLSSSGHFLNDLRSRPFPGEGVGNWWFSRQGRLSLPEQGCFTAHRMPVNTIQATALSFFSVAMPIS